MSEAALSTVWRRKPLFFSKKTGPTAFAALFFPVPAANPTDLGYLDKPSRGGSGVPQKQLGTMIAWTMAAPAPLAGRGAPLLPEHVTVPIRHFQPGDEFAQVAIYNEVAGGLPGFKPAAADEIRRRSLARDFDPTSRLYLEEGGRVVGYVSFHANGRVSYPWCRRGFEAHADALFARAMEGLKARGVARAFAAYHAGWSAQAEFFQRHGFSRAREMVNFAQEILELPTMMNRRGTALSELRPGDIPQVHAMVPGLWRGLSPAELEKHLLRNPYLPPESFFVIRNRADDTPAAVGVLVFNPAYADPLKVDASQPCFRLGAFGTEGLQHKRINGVFSFVCAPQSNMSVYGLDLIGQAVMRLEGTAADALAAQVPSDVPHLLRFYQTHFRVQGKFPVFERTL
jgi:hypothetical protein